MLSAVGLGRTAAPPDDQTAWAGGSGGPIELVLALAHRDGCMIEQSNAGWWVARQIWRVDFLHEDGDGDCAVRRVQAAPSGTEQRFGSRQISGGSHNGVGPRASRKGGIKSVLTVTPNELMIGTRKNAIWRERGGRCGEPRRRNRYLGRNDKVIGRR